MSCGASLLALVGAGCGGYSAATDPTGRFFAVHTAMQTSGMTQVGVLNRGPLVSGQIAKVPLELTSQCLTIVALGGGDVADIDLSLRDSGGKEIAKDDNHGPDASVRICPDQPGKYELQVRAADGSGSYLISLWGGGPSTKSGEAIAAGSSVQSGGGNCDNPAVLVSGQTYVGDSSEGRASEEGSCGNSSAKEVVYRLDLPTRQRVTLDLRAQYDSVMYVRRGQCADSDTEVGCNDDAPGGGRRSRIDQVLDPGTYYVFVDGYGEEEGAYRLTVHTQAAPTSENACGQASQLAFQGTVRGSLNDEPNRAKATCGRDAQGPDHAYRLDIASRSRVRLIETGRSFQPVVHVRSECESIDSQVGCSNEGMLPNEASLVTLLDPGTYWVFADSAVDSSTGDYELSTQVTDIMGGRAKGDTCDDAMALPAMTGDLLGDTFDARDDVAASCTDGGGPDVMYRLDITRKARFIASIKGQESKHRLSLQKSCGARSGELVCGDSVDRVLTPGTYWLAVDGGNRSAFGRFKISYRLQDLGAVESACKAAPALGFGKSINGSTAAGTNNFAASCAGSVDDQAAPDKVYHFTLAKRSSVRVALTSKSFANAVAIYRGCGEQSAEVACRPGTTDYAATIVQVLEPGSYFVVVDGRGSDAAGDFTLDATATPVEGEGAVVAPRPKTPTPRKPTTAKPIK